MMKLIEDAKFVNKLTILVSITGKETKFPDVVTALINRLKYIHGETIFKHFLVLVMNNESISKVQRELKPLFDLDQHQIISYDRSQVDQVNKFFLAKKVDVTVQYTREIN